MGCLGRHGEQAGKLLLPDRLRGEDLLRDKSRRGRNLAGVADLAIGQRAKLDLDRSYVTAYRQASCRIGCPRGVVLRQHFKLQAAKTGCASRLDHLARQSLARAMSAERRRDS